MIRGLKVIRLRPLGWAGAQFTVELSLLMGLIVPILVALLICGFYVHDHAYLQGTACEIAAMGENLACYDDAGERLNQLGAQRTAHALVWGREANAALSWDGPLLQVNCSASFALPSLAAKWLSGGSLSLADSWQMRRLQPGMMIWKARSGKYLMDQALGEW